MCTSSLDSTWFDRDPEQVARDLLGCVLVCERGGARAGGIVVETEAYLGSDDPGSHAATRGMTRRNQVMYAAPGTLYVYVSYGIHHLLNVVCGPEGEAGAVLIRALEPTVGLASMRERRSGAKDVDLCRGPGRLTQALGIDVRDNGTSLGSGGLWVYDSPWPGVHQVGSSGRIGLSEGHDRELRFYIVGSRFVSPAKPGQVVRVRRRDAGGTE